MSRPDQRLFEADSRSAAFRNGVEKGLWGLAEPEVIPDDAAWPMVHLWMKAAAREGVFSRIRRAEIGIHHHIAGPYLAAYAAEMGWREDRRRISKWRAIPGRHGSGAGAPG